MYSIFLAFRGALLEIEGFMAHFYIIGEMGAAFHVYMRLQAKMR